MNHKCIVKGDIVCEQYNLLCDLKIIFPGYKSHFLEKEDCNCEDCCDLIIKVNYCPMCGYKFTEEDKKKYSRDSQEQKRIDQINGIYN